MDDSQPPKELPQWQSHKKVWAAKIESVEPQATPGRALLHLEGDFEVSVDKDYLDRHLPQSGGYYVRYYVRYNDSYESWSPAAAFEEGYTPLEPVLGAGARPPDVGEEDPSIVETAPPFEGG